MRKQRNHFEYAIISLKYPHISLLFSKNLPQIWDITLHRVQNLHPELGQDFPRSELYALNLRHIYARWGEICPESERSFSEVGIICLESEARLCPGGRIFPQI
jgi:hypothetical protein